uniref:Uncharacterized protein n=1 Tax=Setaria viridis TaxID=4556 RepID=A0A4U6TC76_SETVI|nr:hypothetical protein SEVIR_8G057800v2 [Setaria viridis]
MHAHLSTLPAPTPRHRPPASASYPGLAAPCAAPAAAGPLRQPLSPLRQPLPSALPPPVPAPAPPVPALCLRPRWPLCRPLAPGHTSPCRCNSIVLRLCGRRSVPHPPAAPQPSLCRGFARRGYCKDHFPPSLTCHFALQQGD